jgi:hypothetical protein
MSAFKPLSGAKPTLTATDMIHHMKYEYKAYPESTALAGRGPLAVK